MRTILFLSLFLFGCVVPQVEEPVQRYKTAADFDFQVTAFHGRFRDYGRREPIATTQDVLAAIRKDRRFVENRRSYLWLRGDGTLMYGWKELEDF